MIKVEDVFFNTNENEIHILFDGPKREEVENITNEKCNEFINYLKSLNFEKVKSEYDWQNWYINTKNNVFVSITCYFRSIEISFCINKQYNRPTDYLSKIKMNYYGIKCFDYFIKLIEKENLSFSSNHAIRNCFQETKNYQKMTSEEKIIRDYKKSFHHPEAKIENFKLSMLNGKTIEYDNNDRKDRDGKIIYNGDTKFVRINGYLYKGTVYHDLNNMWYIICNDKLYFSEPSYKIFDANEDDLKIKKIKADIKPASYLDKFKNLYPAECNIKSIVYNKTDIKKLARIFTDYCENYLFLTRLKKKIKNMPEEYYYVSNEYDSKTFCEFKINNHIFEIVYRKNNYIIISLNDERILEIDNRILHWNKDMIQKMYLKHKKLFTLLEVLI